MRAPTPGAGAAGAPESPGPLNALTVDLEEYFHVSAYASLIDPAQWERWPSRVAAQTESVLEILAEAGVRATFFCLGWVVERQPVLVRRIGEAGHEIACHGHAHARATGQSPEAFREDIRTARMRIEDVTGAPCEGYRAPSFSIDGSNLWAFREIEGAGFRYSSSIYPVRHDHYGMPGAPAAPFRAPGTEALVEIPVSTVRALGRAWPAGGGGYFRVMPCALASYLVRRVNEREGRPAVFYTHPWEFDPDQPRPDGLPLRIRFRHFVNQGRQRERFRRLVGAHQWGPMREAFAPWLEASRGRQAPPGASGSGEIMARRSVG